MVVNGRLLACSAGARVLVRQRVAYVAKLLVPAADTDDVAAAYLPEV